MNEGYDDDEDYIWSEEDIRFIESVPELPPGTKLLGKVQWVDMKEMKDMYPTKGCTGSMGLADD